jgi:hypothetical protein
MGGFNCGTFVAGIVKVLTSPNSSCHTLEYAFVCFLYYCNLVVSLEFKENVHKFFICLVWILTCMCSVQGVLDGAGFPARVTAHFVAVEGQARPRTTILIKFAEEVWLSLDLTTLNGLFSVWDTISQHGHYLILGRYSVRVRKKWM